MFRCSGNIPCFNQFTRLLQVVATIFRLRCISVSRAHPWTCNHSSQLATFTFPKIDKWKKPFSFSEEFSVLTSFPSSSKPLQAVSGVQVDACKINQFLILLKSADQKEGKIQLSRCSVNIVHLLSALVHPLCTVRRKVSHPELPQCSFFSGGFP